MSVPYRYFEGVALFLWHRMAVLVVTVSVTLLHVVDLAGLLLLGELLQDVVLLTLETKEECVPVNFVCANVVGFI